MASNLGSQVLLYGPFRCVLLKDWAFGSVPLPFLKGEDAAFSKQSGCYQGGVK